MVTGSTSVEVMRSSKRVFAAVGILGFAIVALAILLALRARDLRNQSSIPNAKAPLSIAAEGNGPSKPDKEASKDGPGKQSNGRSLFQIGLYDRYLDEICPRLSAEEEDRLVAESGGDPNVLVGLVFSGSKRGEKWLREALQKAPENPLVHYAILSKVYPGFDRLQSALALAKLAPQDATPLQAAAFELLKKGDQEGAIAALRESAGRDRSSTLYSKAVESAVDTFKLAGRSGDDARVRMFLDGPGRFEGVTLLKLGQDLGLYKASRVEDVSGKEEVAALMLDAFQKGIYSKGLDLRAYTEYRMNELQYLRAFLRTGANTADRSSIEKYFTSPLSEMYSRAKAECDEVSDLMLFSADKPGIYKRLNPKEKTELIERIAKDGETSAFLWAYQTRRDIFRSPNFVPRGWPADGWEKLIESPGRIPMPW
jgi:tetratricopeptide (TPR) repeat protein